MKKGLEIKIKKDCFPRVQELYIDGELCFYREETEIKHIWNSWIALDISEGTKKILHELNKRSMI